MRTFNVRHFFIACIAACALPTAASAQAADNDAPPQLQKLDEGEPPAVTIRKPESKSKITEKRAPGGRVTEIKVTNGKSTYYVKPSDPASGDRQVNRGAQWKVQEFDLGQHAQKKKAQEAAQKTPPPPAAAPSGKK